MFKKKTMGIEKEIEKIHAALVLEDPGTDRYEVLIARLGELEKMKDNKRFRVSGDALFAGAINLTGIGLVLHHEKIGVISSKAFNMIRKVK